MVKKTFKNRKGILIGAVFGLITGSQPILVDICGPVDEGLCFDFFTWPLYFTYELLFFSDYPSANALLVLLVLTLIIFTIFGSIVGLLIEKLFRKIKVASSGHKL